MMTFAYLLLAAILATAALPAAADHAYEAAVAILREATRSKDAFPLVTEEVAKSLSHVASFL